MMNTQQLSTLGCLLCGKQTQVPQLCSHCNFGSYCCEDHQRIDWKQGHNQECSFLTQFHARHQLNALLEGAATRVIENVKKIWNRFLCAENENENEKMKHVVMTMDLCLNVYSVFEEAKIKAYLDDLDLIYLMSLDAFCTIYNESFSLGNAEKCKNTINRALKRAFQYRRMRKACAKIEYANAQTYLGKILFAEGNYKAAFAKFEEALKLYKKERENETERLGTSNQWLTYSLANEQYILKVLVFQSLAVGMPKLSDELFYIAKKACSNKFYLLSLRCDRVEVSLDMIESTKKSMTRCIGDNRVENRYSKRYRELGAKLYSHLVYCTTELPSLATDSLSCNSFLHWSKAIVLASHFYTVHFATTKHIDTMGRDLAKRLLNVHSCSGTCYDAQCAIAVLTGENLLISTESGNTLICPCSPNETAWEHEKKLAGVAAESKAEQKRNNPLILNHDEDVQTCKEIVRMESDMLEWSRYQRKKRYGDCSGSKDTKEEAATKKSKLRSPLYPIEKLSKFNFSRQKYGLGRKNNLGNSKEAEACLIKLATCFSTCC